MARYGKRFAKLLKKARQSPQYWVSKITLDFANSLSDLLEHKGMSKKALAERIGTSPAYITKVLRGDANYTVETMVKLAMAVDARLEIKLVPKAQDDWQPVEGSNVVRKDFRPQRPSAAMVDASNDGEWQAVRQAV